MGVLRSIGGVPAQVAPMTQQTASHRSAAPSSLFCKLRMRLDTLLAERPELQEGQKTSGHTNDLAMLQRK